MVDPFTDKTPVPGRVAWDIQRTLHGLRDDHDYILQWWKLWRDATPLVELLESTWPAWPAASLLRLTTDQLTRCQAFHDVRIRALLWARHTEDMPIAFDERLRVEAQALSHRGATALHSLGDVPTPPPARRRVPSWWGSLDRTP